MRNIIYIIIVLLPIGIHNAVGQCDDFDPATFEHTTNVWDWRDDDPNNWISYLINDQNVANALALPSPFFAQGFSQPNTSDLFLTQIAKDFEPADGWELVYKSFGTSLVDWVENPGFVLYNRFTGMLRVFYWANSDLGQGVTDAVLLNKWDEASEKASSIYAFVESVGHALDQFDTDVTVTAPNIYQNPDGGMWLRFDMTMAYDPCTCQTTADGISSDNLSIMATNASLMTVANVNLQSNTDVVAEGTVSGGQTSATKQKPALFLLGDAIKEGSTRFDGYTKFWENTDNLIQAVDAITSSDVDLNKVKFADWKLPQGLKVLPYIGTVLSVVDFFSTGGQKTAATSPSLVSQMTALKYKTSTTGTFLTASPINGFSYYTPGCNHTPITNNDPTLKPVYDHVLGVFNLVETPKLEYVQYGCNQDNVLDLYRTDYCASGITESCLQDAIPVDMPQIWQFTLMEAPKFIINPAAEVQLMDIEYAIDYQLDDAVGGLLNVGTDQNVIHDRGTQFTCDLPGANEGWHDYAAYPFLGPVYLNEHNEANGTSFEGRLKQQGVELTSWPKDSENAQIGTNNIGAMTFSTGYFRPDCWSDQSIIYSHHPININTPFAYNGDAKYIYNNVKIKLRVKCIFRRIDDEADENTEDIILISSFRCDWSESALNLPFSTDPAVAHTYELSNDRICVAPTGSYTWQIASVYGEDYYVTDLNDKNNPGQSVFPLGNAAFPYNDLISGVVILEPNSKRASRNETHIDNAMVGVFENQVAEITAENEIIISNNSTIHGDVNLYLDSPFDCADNLVLPEPVAHSVVLNTFCNNIDSYDPNIERSFVNISNGVNSANNVSKLTLFPNPTNGNSMISWQYRTNGRIKVEMLALTGELLFQEVLDENRTQYYLNIEDYASGAYLMKISNNSESHVKLISKQ